MKILGTFYGFEQGFGVSRYYKFYVSRDGLQAAWIADRDCELSVARMQASGYTGAIGIVNGVSERARQLEAAYDLDIAADTPWFSRHKQNFSLNRDEIRRLTLLPNAKLKTRPNCYAILNLESARGKRSFYLVGVNERANVGALLENLVPVEGGASLSFVAPVTPIEAPAIPLGDRARKANTLSWVGAILLGIATCAFFYARTHSAFALIGLLLAFKFHGILHNLYVGFNVHRDTAERLEINRRSS
ncbi:hypothetical protein IAD21_01255 [Abditibacteriota bacterium]|nr:hypothetical protein IAD21_01255 [Abditibacteriota bacterium]